MSLDLTATRPAFFAHFGEALTVVPPTGEPYEIVAVINRDQPGPVDHDGQVRAVTIISVKNHASEGIDGATLDTKRHRVRYPLQVGREPVEKSIRSILSMDAAVIELEVGS